YVNARDGLAEVDGKVNYAQVRGVSFDASYRDDHRIRFGNRVNLAGREVAIARARAAERKDQGVSRLNRVVVNHVHADRAVASAGIDRHGVSCARATQAGDRCARDAGSRQSEV